MGKPRIPAGGLSTPAGEGLLKPDVAKTVLHLPLPPDRPQT